MVGIHTVIDISKSRKGCDVTKPLISREEAYALGLKRFYTGKPCKRGHDSERYTSIGSCAQCQNWKLPPKTVKKNMPNSFGWPHRALIFNAWLGPFKPEEIQAAFMYIERHGWHNAAIEAVRKEGLETYLPVPEAKEVGVALAAAETLRRRVSNAQRRESGAAPTDTVAPPAYVPNPVPFKHKD